jgi:hypothetical protein
MRAILQAGKETAVIRMFIRHPVNDYNEWRVVYDAFAPEQQAGGVQAEEVYCSADDRNDVTVTHDFATIEEAKRFVENPLLKDTMQRAGVAGTPSIWFTQQQ